VHVLSLMYAYLELFALVFPSAQWMLSVGQTAMQSAIPSHTSLTMVKDKDSSPYAHD
jgi:hypothetical protein